MPPWNTWILTENMHFCDIVLLPVFLFKLFLCVAQRQMQLWNNDDRLLLNRESRVGLLFALLWILMATGVQCWAVEAMVDTCNTKIECLTVKQAHNSTPHPPIPNTHKWISFPKWILISDADNHLRTHRTWPHTKLQAQTQRHTPATSSWYKRHGSAGGTMLISKYKLPCFTVVH